MNRQCNIFQSDSIWRAFLSSLKYFQSTLENASFCSSRYIVCVILFSRLQVNLVHSPVNLGTLSQLSTRPDSTPRKCNLHSFWRSTFSSLTIIWGVFLIYFFTAYWESVNGRKWWLGYFKHSYTMLIYSYSC